MRLRSAIVIASILAATPAAPRADEVILNSLEWPPFAGALLPDRGVAVALVAATFADMGLRLRVNFLPWARTMRTACANGASGYFPEYPLDADAFALSASFGESDLGLAHRADAPLLWTDPVVDLRDKVIGVVDGYVNTAAIDAAIASGAWPNVRRSVDDATNLRLAGAGRIDGAIVDRAVFAHLLATRADVRAFADALTFHPKTLETKTLHVAFCRDAEELKRRFDAALSARGGPSSFDADRAGGVAAMAPDRPVR